MINEILTQLKCECFSQFVRIPDFIVPNFLKLLRDARNKGSEILDGLDYPIVDVLQLNSNFEFIDLQKIYRNAKSVRS